MASNIHIRGKKSESKTIPKPNPPNLDRNIYNHLVFTLKTWFQIYQFNKKKWEKKIIITHPNTPYNTNSKVAITSSSINKIFKRTKNIYIYNPPKLPRASYFKNRKINFQTKIKENNNAEGNP